MKKILIINRAQYGSHTDTFKYTQYLKKSYNVTYICFDTGAPKFEGGSVNVVYISRAGNVLHRFFRLINNISKEVKVGGFDFVFIVYFPLCSLISILNRKLNSCCDIRTLSVNKNILVRYVLNFILNVELLFFSKVSAISEGVINQLYLPILVKKNIKLLPLGGDPIGSKIGSTTKGLKLFYVGTLDGRNISDTVKGFSSYLDATKSNENSCYNIVGFGSKQEESKLIDTIGKLNLEGKVTFHGRLSHEECIDLVNRSNVGVCYYPQTSFYDKQPPTKLFEYVLSGLPCISVTTEETKKYIDSRNGVLINDNPDSFHLGLERINSAMPYDLRTVKETLQPFLWGSIVKKYFRTLI